MTVYDSSCHCGHIRVEVDLTDEPGAYNPRACDCRFCRLHGGAYLSDPSGSMKVLVVRGGGLGRYRQGAEQADMLFCQECAVLAGVCYSDSGVIAGAANARLFSLPFGAEVVVSPKQLSPSEKVFRWGQLWFQDVQIDESGA